MCAYSTSKAGVIGLAKAVGKEYAETNITVNALAPAVIRTGVCVCVCVCLCLCVCLCVCECLGVSGRE